MKIEIVYWPITKFRPYNRNPRKNDHAVDQMVESIQEFGFKIPALVRSTGEIVDGHLRLKAAQKLGFTELPVILCDEWTEAQVKAFRLMVNRSVSWAEWDTKLVALEIQELRTMNFDLKLTGFDPIEIESFSASTETRADQVPDVPAQAITQSGELWNCGNYRVLCGDATSPDAVRSLLGSAQPVLMVTDPPYGIQLDSEWRDRAGLNGHGKAEASYMKHRTEGHSNTSISSDDRADWSEAFSLVS